MNIPFGQAPDMNDQKLKIITPKLMRKLRNALGLSQVQMAKLIGVSRQMVNYYEMGDAYPSTGTWLNWIEAVEKQINKLRRQARL